MSASLLEMTGVSKSFPGVLALDDVSFSVGRSEIRALMGENGAGKSTLIKVLTGVHRPDKGIISLGGTVIEPRSPVHAQELGVSTVYQEVNLAPNLSVAENVCLGRGGLTVDWRAMRERAASALKKLDVEIEVARPLGEFSTAVQQLVAIARAIDRSAEVLVLDEPTSSLDRDEATRLFDLLRKLRDEGMSIVFVSHFLDQVYAVSDSITVLRNGRKVGDWPVSELTQRRLVEHMIGRDLESVPLAARATESRSKPMFSAKGIGKDRTLEPVTFNVNQGETVGLCGLLGSGRTETMKLVFGAESPDHGVLEFDGLTYRPRSPRDSIRLGIGFCPEDRKAEGICPGLSVAENLLLVVQARRGWLRRIPKKKAAAIVNDHVARLQVKTPDAGRPIETLSGGNQQKVLLSRWLAADPRLLLLDEPTRGIDVGSKFEIRTLIVSLAERGMSFLFSSAELEEVVHTCDRVVVLRDRRVVGQLEGDDVTEPNVMSQIAESEA